MLTKLFHGRDERCFERFRRTGDAAALAEVFDRTAPELFGLAARLAPAPGLAQDLLQQTFLAAIESAGSWDSARRLAPWLVGILVREARLLRRREARVPEAERMGVRASTDPLHAAAEREFSAALARALESVPQRYRQVLELHLVAEKPAAEIASELGRTSGTVRVQIHRGLELLRKALPAGFAAAGAMAVSPRALADVRTRVLAAAPAAPSGAPVGAPLAPAGAAVGGLALEKVALAAVVVLVAAGALWLALEPSAREELVAHAEPSAVEARGETAVALTTAPATGTPEQSTARQSVPEEKGPTRGAGLHGRLLDADGTPVAGMAVDLLEVPPELLELDIAAFFAGERAEPRIVLASARTDAEGRFRFDGARRRALHALGIDLGGRRGTLRLLDEGLAEEETTDVGDVVLAPAAELTGRVVDTAGSPIAGARVRVVEPFAEEALENDLQRFRSTSVAVEVAERWRERTDKISFERTKPILLPRWLTDLVERLPVPTASSDADGRFALDAPIGRPLVLVVDDPRFASAVREDLRVDRATDVGSIALEAGRVLACRVVDAAGAPVAGAEVLCGTLEEDSELAVCGPAVAGEDGIHRGVGGRSAVELYLARADARSSWTIAGPFEREGIKDVVLESPCSLLLDVHDGSGGPVDGLEVLLAPADGLLFQDEFEFLGPWRAAGGELQRMGDTKYAIPGVTPGVHLLWARAPGREVTGALALPPAPVELALFPAKRAEVRVVDEASGAPLAGAAVEVRWGPRGRYVVVGRALTDVNGRTAVDWGSREEKIWQVRAEHEGYAAVGATLAEETGSIELRLARPARVAARVHGGEEVPARHLLALQPLDESLRTQGSLPWHAITDAEGRCEIDGLSPGEYRYDLGERFLGGDPLPDLVSGRLARNYDFDKGILERRLASGIVELRAGEEALLDIDLEERRLDGDATLSGRLVRDGRGMAGIELELHFVAENVWNGDRRSTFVRTTDASGAFDFGGVPAGTAYLKGEDYGLGSTILRLEFPLAAGERRVLDLAFDPLTVDLALVDAEGQPLSDAELQLTAHSRLYEYAHVPTRTDGAGRARVTLPGCGLFAWEADAGGRHAEGTVYVLPGEELTLAFQPLVELPLQLTFPPELACSAENMLLKMRPSGDGTELRVLGPLDSTELRVLGPLDPSTWSFAFEGLPGRYWLTVVCGDRRCRPIELDVRPAGLSELRLTLELAE